MCMCVITAGVNPNIDNVVPSLAKLNASKGGKQVRVEMISNGSPLRRGPGEEAVMENHSK